MKKIALVFASTLLFIGSISAQEGFQLGLNLSPNISWMTEKSENLESKGQNLGFNFGVVADFNITENYAFGTGLNIIRTGGELQYADVQTISFPNGVSNATGGRTKADLDLQYIEVPLTLKLSTNEIGYLTYFGQFGLGLGFNIGARADTDFEYAGGSGSVSRKDVDFRDEINFFRTSLIVGAGAEYNLSGNTSILLGITFNNGFSNVLSEDTYEQDANGNGIPTSSRSKEFKAVNNYLVLNLGVLF